MEYYYINKKGELKNTPTIVVRECILNGFIEDTKEKIQVVMNEEQFNEWREKMEDGNK